MKRFVIVGLGNFGSSVAESLFAKGHEVIAIDPNEDAVDRVAPHVTRAAVGDGRDVHVLERIGAQNSDAGVIGTGDDITASILSAMALHDVHIRDVYVKVISRDHARVMDRIGVTESIFPERESALALGARISGTGLLNYVRLGPGFSTQEMAVPESWTGQTLRKLELRKKFSISVIAIHDVLTDKINPAPEPDALLKDSDTLLVAGRDEDLVRIASVS
jgi:trk system potassium uptake protein